MARSSRVAVLTLVLVLCAGLGGCAPKRNGVLGYEVDGKTVAAQIDHTIVPALRAAHPALAIGKSACPWQIDVAYDATGTCTIPAGEATLPVEVANGPGTVLFVVRRVRALVVLDETEKQMSARLLAFYGTRSAVRCGEPRVRIVEVNTNLACTTAVTGRRTVPIAVTVWNRDGDAGFKPLPGVLPLETTVLGPYLRGHARRGHRWSFRDRYSRDSSTPKPARCWTGTSSGCGCWARRPAQPAPISPGRGTSSVRSASTANRCAATCGSTTVFWTARLRWSSTWRRCGRWRRGSFRTIWRQRG